MNSPAESGETRFDTGGEFEIREPGSPKDHGGSGSMAVFGVELKTSLLAFQDFDIDHSFLRFRQDTFIQRLHRLVNLNPYKEILRVRAG